MLLFRIAAHILECQHRNRRLVRKRERSRQRLTDCCQANAIDAHRLGNVLELLRAQIIESQIEFALHVVEDRSRNVDPPGSANASNRAATFTPSP